MNEKLNHILEWQKLPYDESHYVADPWNSRIKSSPPNEQDNFMSFKLANQNSIIMYIEEMEKYTFW